MKSAARQAIAMTGPLRLPATMVGIVRRTFAPASRSIAIASPVW
jgi:hypothetical protein